MKNTYGFEQNVVWLTERGECLSTPTASTKFYFCEGFIRNIVIGVLDNTIVPRTRRVLKAADIEVEHK